MIESLNNAVIVSSELPNIPLFLPELGAMVEETRGRPRININPDNLTAHHLWP
jgi:hypothetical protein